VKGERVKGETIFEKDPKSNPSERRRKKKVKPRMHNAKCKMQMHAPPAQMTQKNSTKCHALVRPWALISPQLERRFVVCTVLE